MASYTNPSDVLSDIRRSTVFTPLANFAASIRSITDATRAIKRIETSEINDSILSFVKKSDELKRASRIIRANPGVFESRSQAIAWSNKARSISMDAGGNRLSAFQRQFGHTAGTSLFNQENAQLFTNRMAEIGRSPRQQRIFDYYQQFGGAASADAMDRAEDVVRAEDERKRSEDRLEGRRAFAYDTADDYTKMRHDLRDKYKSSALADAKIRRDALKKLPNWMKALIGGEKTQTKTLFNLANKFDDATKIPIIGHMLKNPFALGLGTLGLISSIMGRSDQANTSVVDWQNAANLSGAPSKRFSKLALLAGDKDPAAIARRFGKATLKFGDAEMFYSSLAPQIKNVSPIARMAIASQLGLDETDFAIMDMMSGRITPDRTRRAMAGKNMAEQLKEVGLSSGAGVFDTLEAWRLSIPGMSSAAARDYADIDYVRNKSNKNYGASMDKYIYGAIDSANNYQQTYGTGASNGTGGEKTITVNVNTGDVVLPNAQNGNDVIKGIINYSADKSDCEAVLHMFDSKTE